MEGFTLALHGRKALVTGGSRGIGRAIALALAQAGSDLAVVYRHQADAASEVVELARGMGREATALQADVSDPAGAARLVQTASARLRGLNLLVNAAGILRRRPFLEIPFEEWREILATNLDGVFAVSQAAARLMGGLGRRRRDHQRLLCLRPGAGPQLRALLGVQGGRQHADPPDGP